MAEAPEDGPKDGSATRGMGALVGPTSQEADPLRGVRPMDLPHRDGTRVMVGTPIHVGGEKPWMCAVKLMGKKKTPPRGAALEEELTQTLLLRTGRGGSPEEAQRAALAELKHFYGSPNEPIPQPLILDKDKAAEPPPLPAAAPKRGLLRWLAGLFKN
jgi:hypothetical protein